MSGRRGSKQLRKSAWGDLVGRDAAHLQGVLAQEEGATAYHELTDDGELIVSVRLDDHGAVIWARWAPGLLAPNFGVIGLPPEGTEVLVAFPQGDYEGDPIVIGACSTGAGVPIGDMAAGRILVVGSEVWVYSGTGTPLKLPTLADVQTIRDQLHQHEHSYIPDGSGVPAVTTAGPNVTSPTGTDVIKVK